MKTSKSSAIIYLSVGAAALSVLATGIYFMSHQAGTPVAASLHSRLQTSIPQRESTPGKIVHSQKIELAMSAYSAGKLVTPAGENAFEYYLAALQSKPNDIGAQEAIMELVPVAMTALESAIAANTASEVERLIPLLERADPGAARVVALKQRWQANVANIVNVANLAEQASVLAQPTIEVQETAPAQANYAPETVPTIAPLPEPTVVPTVAPKVASPPPLVVNTTQIEPVRANLRVTSAEVQTRVVEARTLSTARAVFPAQARRQKIEGWVDLQVAVDANGRVTEALVVGAQPSRVFDVEARRAVMRWRYSPKLVNDQPVSSVLRQRIKFSLEG